MAMMCCYVSTPGGNVIGYGDPAYSHVINSNNPHIYCPPGAPPIKPPIKPGQLDR